MPVNYYHTNFGTFSVIVSDSVMAGLSSISPIAGYITDSNGITAYGRDIFALIPFSSLVTTIGISAAAQGYDPIPYNHITTYIPGVAIKQVAAMQQSTLEYEYYYLEGFNFKKVRIGARLDTSNAGYLRMESRFENGNNYVNNPSNSMPYGRFTFFSSNDNQPNYIIAGFLVASEDFTTFKWINVTSDPYSRMYFNFGTLSSDQNNTLKTFFDGVTPDSDDPGGGGGDDDDDDPYSDVDGETDLGDGDIIDIPNFPGLSATDAGIIGLFVPSVQQMQDLADFMWTDFGGTGTTVEDILSEIVEALKRSISNPLDYVLGLNIIPSQGLSVGSSKVIRFGFVSSGVSMPRLADQYFSVDCGSLSFDAVCGDTFLDYAPYSKFSIYLPYIGVREVDANDFVGHTIGVVYHGDVITGGITAYVTKDGSVMYQYSGSCALNVPLSADNWGNTISAAVNVATAIIAGRHTAGAAGMAKAAAEGAASVAANPSLLSPQVAHSGAVSGSAGCMGVQVPYVIREAVRFHSTENFNKFSGYPSFYYKSLSDMSGYTRILDLHLHDIPATQEEVQEIESILKEGAIF